MSDESVEPKGNPECPDCGGATVKFRGEGLDVEYRICPHWKEPGHLSEDEVKDRIRLVKRQHYPASGRFA